MASLVVGKFIMFDFLYSIGRAKVLDNIFKFYKYLIFQGLSDLFGVEAELEKQLNA